MMGIAKAETKPDMHSNVDWSAASIGDIKATLLKISPLKFEQLVQNLMQHWGYRNVRVTGRSGDEGIDVIAQHNTPAGIHHVAAQCKRHSAVVGVDFARDFFGALLDKQVPKGYLMTTSDFSPECKVFCEKHGIQMLSGLEIARDIKRFGIKV